MKMIPKNKLLLILFALLMLACGDDIETNTPSIQGEANNEFFRAQDSKAVVNVDGSITITGTTGVEKIKLQTRSVDPGVYDLSEEGNTASFTNDTIFYTTGITPGKGKIKIIKQEDGGLYGKFQFNAFSAGQKDTLVFEHGDFFKLPLQSGTIEQ